MSLGKKGLHYSVNSSGSIPGTGISYTKTIAKGSKSNNQNNKSSLTSNNPYKLLSSKPVKDTSIPSMILGILSLITGCCCLGGLLGIIGGALARTAMKNFGRNIFNIIGFATSCLGIMLASGMLAYGILHPATTPTDNKTAKQTTVAISTDVSTTEVPTTAESTTEEVTTEEATSEKPDSPEVTTEKPAKKKTTQEPLEEQVWISRTGSKYHSNSSCSGMKNPSQVSINRAENMGLTPCKRCYR